MSVARNLKEASNSMTDGELRQRFDAMDQKIDNLTRLQEETLLEVGEVKTRLGRVETAVNRAASEVGVPGVPAIGGSTSVAAMAAKGKR